MRRKYAARAVIELTFGGESPSDRAIDLIAALPRHRKPQSWPDQGGCEAEWNTLMKKQASYAAPSAATTLLLFRERPAR
jgi:hypothetical protein